MAHSLGLLLDAAFFHRSDKGHLLRSRLQANCNRLWQALAMLCLLWAFHAPASAAVCNINVPTTANSQATYFFTLAEMNNCDPASTGIAYDSSGSTNDYGNNFATSTAQGGQLFVYNDIHSDGSFQYAFKYSPATNFVGTDSATFFTSNNALSWSPNGTVTFSVTAPPPTVTSISPATANAGTTVTIIGTNFLGVTQVRFGGTTASHVVNGPTSISATVPTGPIGTVDVTVTTASGTSATSSSDQFTYTVPPTVSSVSPTSGTTAGGTSVTISGTNLSGATAVRFGATTASITGNTATSITATAPAGSAGTVDITVITAGGTSATSAADQYTYVAAPTVTAVSPTSAGISGGTSVTITGTNFTGATSVRFGATSASFIINNATSISATSPAGSAGTVDITVTTPGGTSATSAADQFTYVVAPPVANAVSATVAHGSSSNPITLNITGGAPTSVAVASPATHGTATANGTAITYTPTASYSGTDSFTYTATNGSGTSSPATVTITVSAATISYAPASPSAGTVGNGYNQSLASASGGTAPYSYAIVSGALPAGVTFGPNGTLSGTPTQAGSFNFTVTATDSSTGTGPFSATSGALTLVVGTPTISISPGSLSAASVGTAYNSTLSASGGTGPYSFSLVAGTLPAGLTLASNGTLSGTPTAGGTFNLTVRATDSSTGTGAPFSTDRAYTLTVNAATITLIPGSLPAASVGTAYSSMVTASGGTAPYGYAVTSGALPAGLTLAPNGTLSGTPMAGGTFNFTITATDSSSGTPSTGSQAYTLSLGVPTLSLSPSSGASFNGNAGSSFSQSFSASGGLAPYHFAALTITAGSLPTGLSYNTATGTLSGTPTSAGTVSFQITATDSTTGAGPASQTGSYTLTIAAPTITVNPGTLPNATIGAGYSQTVSASGGTAPYGYTVSTGSLPTGLTLNSANGSISGTPTAQGSFSFTITATDANTFTSARSYTVTVQVSAPTAPPVTVSTGPNQPVTIHATANATGGPFTAVNVSTTPTSGTVTVQGMDLVYTPAASTQGAINFAYTLSNAGGTSAPIAVTVQVVTRPDPTADATVQGITASQQQAAVRFAGTQLMNFTQRLEHLRNPHRSTFTNGLQLAMPRMVNTEMRRCQSATSLLEQQECISNQGRMGRGSLTPGWSRAAQLNAAAAAQGMNTERAFASSAQVFGQDALPTEVGGTTSANRPLSAAQQFMAKAYPEHAQMTALPTVDATIAEPGSATRPRLAYWTSGMVDWGFADATAGQDDGLRFTTSGVTMGMDYLLSKEWTVGMGIGFAYDRTKIGNEGSRNHSKGVSTALYGSWSPAPAYFVDGVVGYSRMSFDTRRWVADAGEFAQGERDGSQWFAALSAGYEWRTEQWMLSPYGRLQFARSSLDAYTETGAGWHALHFDKQSITNTSASLGLRGEVSHETRWGMLLPFGRLELQHDFNHQSDVRLSYAELTGTSQNYSISSTTLGRNRVQLGFGSRLQSRVGTFAAEMQFTSSSHSFQRGLRLMYTTRW